MDQDLKKALLKLDVGNDEHWTADGFPRVEALGIAGLKRGQLMKAAPYFTRTHPTFEAPVQDEPEGIEDSPFNVGAPDPHEQQGEAGINFESSEFGGAAPLASKTKQPTQPELQEQLRALQGQLAEVEAEQTKLLQQATRLKRRIDEVQMQMGAPVSSTENQKRIMNFLAHTQGSPQPVAQIDRAFQPQRDPAQQRPVRTPRDVSPQ